MISARMAKFENLEKTATKRQRQKEASELVYLLSSLLEISLTRRPITWNDPRQALEIGEFLFQSEVQVRFAWYEESFRPTMMQGWAFKI
jgi:hypothetical protein